MQVVDRAVFAGRSDRKIYPYGMCNVFIMPSRDQTAGCEVEGFGLVLEATASSKPVIAGRSGGVPDAVLGGVSGFLVNSMNVDDIANTIVKLLADHDLAQPLRLPRKS